MFETFIGLQRVVRPIPAAAKTSIAQQNRKAAGSSKIWKSLEGTSKTIFEKHKSCKRSCKMSLYDKIAQRAKSSRSGV